MIRFTLVCAEEHSFESWFPSGSAYDAQAVAGLVECPVCGSKAVSKGLMAPALTRAARGGQSGGERASEPTAPQEAAPATPDTAVPVAIASERDKAMRAMLRAFREHVTANADNVGRRFPNEARKMHYGEVEHRSIYGEASPAEARALLEEGIEVHAMPVMPDDRN